jgi:hypothetical protein
VPFYVNFANKAEAFLALRDQQFLLYKERFQKQLQGQTTRAQQQRSVEEHVVELALDESYILLELEFKLFAIRHPRLLKRVAKKHVEGIQGMMRHSKASTTTDVYMQSLEAEVRTAINSIHGELMGTGTTGPVPQEPATASAMNRSESANPKAETKNESPAKERKAASTQEEMPLTKPVKGVVLEFATRMRQSRRREVLLND